MPGIFLGLKFLASVFCWVCNMKLRRTPPPPPFVKYTSSTPPPPGVSAMFFSLVDEVLKLGINSLLRNRLWLSFPNQFAGKSCPKINLLVNLHAPGNGLLVTPVKRTVKIRAVGRILLGWVRAPEAWASRRNPGVYFPGKFWKIKLLKSTFPSFWESF